MTDGQLVRVDAENPDEVQLLAHGWVLTFSDYRDGRGWWLTVKSTVSDLVDSPAVEIPRSAMGPLSEWLAERARLVQGGA